VRNIKVLTVPEVPEVPEVPTVRGCDGASDGAKVRWCDGAGLPLALPMYSDERRPAEHAAKIA
jgi:hypothetical protein